MVRCSLMSAYTYKNLVLDKPRALQKSVLINAMRFIALSAVGAAMLYAASLDNPWLIRAGFVALGAVMFALTPVFVHKTMREQLWSQLHKQFADNNNLKFYTSRLPFSQRSHLFDRGTNRQLCDVVVIQKQPSTWLGSYRFDEDAGEARATLTVHVAAIHLQTPLPHVVFDAGRRVRRQLLFGTESEVALPEPVPHYSRIYADAHFHGYVQQLLSPGVRRQLRRLRGQYDIEIVGDDLLLLRNMPPKPSAEQLQAEIESLGALRKELAKIAKKYPPTRVPETSPFKAKKDSWDEMVPYQ